MNNPNDAVALHMRTAEKCAASFGRRFPHLADDLRGVAMLELVRLAHARLELTPWYVCRRLAGAMLDHARAHGRARSRSAEWPAADLPSPCPSPELGAFARELCARLGDDDERAPAALAMVAAGAELDDVGRASGLSRAGACRMLQRARTRAAEITQ